MKFTKMSLVAALLIGSSAFALDNVKVSGDAKLYYHTEDGKDTNSTGSTTSDNGSLFSQQRSAGQAALGLGVTADLAAGISAGVHATVLSTLGLENSLVSGVWAGNITPGNAVAGNGNQLQGSNGTAWWIDNAWVAATMGKTTAKVGRMDIDTPLAFTETWNIAKNTFEAAVLINQDIPDTTLVLAYVGGSNGADGSTVANAQNGTTPFTGYTSYNDGAARVGDALPTTALDAVGGAGAYAVGVVNNSFAPLTAQAWYYNVTQVADAYWLQADLKCQLVPGLLVGAQYADMTLKDNVTSMVDGATHGVANVVAAQNLAAGYDVFDLTTTAYALMVGYEMKDVATVKVAYSSVSDNGILNVQNTATGDASKLYTEAWWNYGVVGAAGADTIALTVDGSVEGYDLTAQYTYVAIDRKGTGTNVVATSDTAAKLNELTLAASKTFGPLDVSAAYIYTSIKANDNGFSLSGMVDGEKRTSNALQAYLTLNF